MGKRKGTLRKVSIAMVAIVVALAAAPTASAVCVGEPPIWWPHGGCGTSSLPPNDFYICISDDPLNDCVP